MRRSRKLEGFGLGTSPGIRNPLDVSLWPVTSNEYTSSRPQMSTRNRNKQRGMIVTIMQEEAAFKQGRTAAVEQPNRQLMGVARIWLLR